MNIKTKLKNKGFTLIELLVAIGIIGILSSFLMANFIGVRQRARDGVRKADLRQIQAAVELYRSDQGLYPSDASFAACGGTSSLSAGSPAVVYMQKIPCDPLTNTIYIYTSPAGNATYSLKACLENTSDTQRDSPDTCAGATVSYTLQNP